MEKNEERIRWACRRGMLELDLFLVPFFENCFCDLTSLEKESFQKLLLLNDPEILALLMAHTMSSDEKQAEIIEKVRAFRLFRGEHQIF